MLYCSYSLVQGAASLRSQITFMEWQDRLAQQIYWKRADTPYNKQTHGLDLKQGGERESLRACKHCNVNRNDTQSSAMMDCR